MQEAPAKNPITSKKTSSLKITITGPEAISALNTKNLKDLNPYERLAHVKNKINQTLIEKISTAINDKKETCQHVKSSSLLYDNPQHKLTSKPQSLSYDSLQCKLATKRPSPFYKTPTEEPLERNDGEPANQGRIEFLNKKLNEIPKASIKVGSRQQYKCLPPNNTINKQLPHGGEFLAEKQFHSTIKVPHNLTNETPKESIKAGKRQCLSLNNEIYKQLPHEEELLAAKQSTVTVNVSHNTTDEIPKASIKTGESECLSLNDTVNEHLSVEGELLTEHQSRSTVSVPHNPTNETSKVSFIVVENQKQHCISLSLNNTINTRLTDEKEFLAVNQLHSTVEVPHNPTNEIPKASVKVGNSQRLSSNNTIYKQEPSDEELLTVKRSSSTVNVSHNPTNEIPKASIKEGESEQQKLKYLPSNNKIYKQLQTDGELLAVKRSSSTVNVSHNTTDEIPKASIKTGESECLSLNNTVNEHLSVEGELLTEHQSRSTVSVPHNPTNETSKVSFIVVENQKQHCISLSLNNTINTRLTDEKEFLAVNQLHSTVEVPHNPTNEIPKASVKVGNSQRLSSNNTIYKQEPSDEELLTVKRSSSTGNVSHNSTNEIPKASIKEGESEQQKIKYLPSDNTVYKQLSNKEELLTEQQSHFTVSAPHSPANKTSIKVVEVKRQQCKSLSFNDASNKELSNEAELLTVKVANNPKTKIPKASVKVGRSQNLSSNNTIYKQLLQDGKPLAATKIPKASIKAGESERLKFNCLPSSNTVYNQLSNEGKLSTEKQSHATVNVPHSPTNETQKVSVKVGEGQKLQNKSLSLNNTINIKLSNEEEQLVVKQLCSTIKLPQNSINEIPKASVKVGKKRLSSNNTIHKELQRDGKLSDVEQIYSTVSHKPANKIPKASVKVGKSKQHKCLSPNKTIIESLPFEGEQLNVIYNAINEIPKASINVGTSKK